MLGLGWGTWGFVADCKIFHCSALASLVEVHRLSLWDLSFPARDRTHAPFLERLILNRWTTMKSWILLIFLYWFIQNLITMINPSLRSYIPVSNLQCREWIAQWGAEAELSYRWAFQQLLGKWDSDGKGPSSGCTGGWVKVRRLEWVDG